MSDALSRRVPELQQILHLLERCEPYSDGERFAEEVFSAAHQGGDVDAHAPAPDKVAHALHAEVKHPPEAMGDSFVAAVVADCWVEAYEQAKSRTAEDEEPTPQVVQQAAAAAQHRVKAATQPDALAVAAAGHGAGDKEQERAFRARAVNSTPEWRRAFLRVLGRMRADLRASPKGEPGISGDVGRDLGRRIAEVPRTELARARRSPAAWRGFLHDLVKGAAPQVLRETVRSSDGPVVVLLDVSGSMADVLDEAHAVACAVMAWAVQRRRAAVLIPFAERAYAAHTLKDAVGMHLNMGWGTDIAAGIIAAHKHIASHPKFRAADVLLVSDGDSAHVEVRHPRIRTHGIAVVPEMVAPLTWWCAPQGTVTTLQDIEAGNTAALTQALRSHA